MHEIFNKDINILKLRTSKSTAIGNFDSNVLRNNTRKPISKNFLTRIEIEIEWSMYKQYPNSWQANRNGEAVNSQPLARNTV